METAATFHAFAHPDDLVEHLGREARSVAQLVAALDKRDSYAQDLEDAFVRAVLVDTYTAPSDTMTRGGALCALVTALDDYETARIAAEMVWGRCVGRLPARYRRPEPASQPVDDPLTPDESLLERPLPGGFDVMLLLGHSENPA